MILGGDTVVGNGEKEGELLDSPLPGGHQVAGVKGQSGFKKNRSVTVSDRA